jgi:transcriptional regulator with XRE-family HTH domain
MGIGHKIKNARVIKNITQEYIAEQLGVSRRWYMKLENDEATIKEDTLHKISQILDINIDELKSFDNKKVFNSYFHDNSTNQGNVFYIENENLKKEKESFEKEILLYKELVKEKNARILTLEKLIKKDSK